MDLHRLVAPECTATVLSTPICWTNDNKLVFFWYFHCFKQPQASMPMRATSTAATESTILRFPRFPMLQKVLCGTTPIRHTKEKEKKKNSYILKNNTTRRTDFWSSMSAKRSFNTTNSALELPATVSLTSAHVDMRVPDGLVTVRSAS